MCAHPAFFGRCRSTFLTFLVLTLTIITPGCTQHLPSTSGVTEPSFAQEGAPADVSVPTFAGTQSDLSCADSQPDFITGFDVFQTPSIPEPAPRVPFRDPVFGTCMVRVTDRSSDLAPGDPSEGMKNEYSRVQSFNANGSHLLVRGIEATWYLYDAQTLQPVSQIPLEIDPRWSPTDPSLIYFFNETRLMSYDIQDNVQTVVHDFALDFPGQTLLAVWTRYEGSPSADGRYWGLMAEDENWLTSAYLIYDLQVDAVIATLDLRSWPDDAREIDSVTVSPLGNYFLSYMDKYCDYGQLGTESDPCGLMVYDHALSNGRGLLRIVGHADLALDAEGQEVMVFQDIDTDSISLLDLTSGDVTALLPIDFSYSPIGLHFSGRAFQVPGWALVSTYEGARPAATWMDDQVFAIELKPGGRVVRLAHTHSLVDPDQEKDYWAEPHVSVNQDFTRILFTSNWGRAGTGQVEMYMIQLPSDWIELLPQ